MAPAVYSDSEYQQRMRDWQAERDPLRRRQRQAYEADRRAYDSRYSLPRAPATAGRLYRGTPAPIAATATAPARRAPRPTTRKVAGTLIGALVGGALGANIASEKVETEGAVLGAVVGGALGAGIASGTDERRYGAACDTTGYYYSYGQTFPYREDASYRGRASGRYDYGYYNHQRCRLAVAPADWNGRTDYRYVRVCPDRAGRYRITA